MADESLGPALAEAVETCHSARDTALSSLPRPKAWSDMSLQFLVVDGEALGKRQLVLQRRGGLPQRPPFHRQGAELHSLGQPQGRKFLVRGKLSQLLGSSRLWAELNPHKRGLRSTLYRSVVRV